MLNVLFFVLTFVSTVFLAFRNNVIFVFVLYQGFYFFNPKTKWWASSIPDISYSFYIVLSLIIIVAVKWNKLSENKISSIPQFWCMYILVAMYGIATTYAVFPQVHGTALDALVTVAVLITVVYKLVQTEKQLDYIIWGYVIFAGYLGYYISEIGRVSGGRFEGAGMVDSPDANGLAAALAPALIFYLYLFWVNTNIKIKLGLVVGGAFLANAMVQIGSRGAFLGIAIGCAVFIYILFFSKMQRKNQKLSVILILLLGLVGVATVTDRLFWERMSSIKNEGLEQTEEKETGSTRVFFWKAAIEMAKDYPFGTGASGFIYFSPLYIPESIDTGRSRNRAVHSTWFEVLSEVGYIGFFALCGMIYYSFRTAYKASQRLKLQGDVNRYFKVIAISCALLCFVVCMTFVNRIRAEILYWCVLYTAIAYNIFVLKSPDSKIANHRTL